MDSSADAAKNRDRSPPQDTELDDLLQELRILLQGVQVLTAFLVLLPFNQGFAKINGWQHWLYISTFLCSLLGLILFSAPAVHHRLTRPLLNRVSFKNFATRMTVIGLIPSSFALVCATQLVIAAVIGDLSALPFTLLVALCIAGIWWLLPLAHKHTPSGS